MAAAVRQPDPFEFVLRQQEEKELLRLSTAGSVDDGKSTLIGRLLYDSKGVYEDQLASVSKVKQGETAGTPDFALITDGLRAEREQGITIDVAYRYFSTPKRKFIIADTPGHEQYTRNMVTGASTANLAIILVDARKGVLAQSRRHAFIASLLGIPHIVVAVNKMDLVGYSEAVFDRIREDFMAFAAPLQVLDLHFIPISALLGDNVVEKSRHMPWFEGESLLPYLEDVHIASDRNLAEMRFPVQYVIRPNQEFRGYAGQVASGVMKQGDTVMALPSGQTSRISSIVTYDGELPKAFPPMSVTVCLEDELDISRGDMLVHPSHAPHVTRSLDARIVWMSHTPLALDRQYVLKHTSREVKAEVRAIRYRMNINTLEKEPATELRLNDIGAAVIETRRPLFVDPYRRNRAVGGFILIDPLSNETVAAGMITGREPKPRETASGRRGEAGRESERVTPAERSIRMGHRPAAIWLAQSPQFLYALERRLFDRGCAVTVLTSEDSGCILPELAQFLVNAGLIAICAVDKINWEERERAKALIGSSTFVDMTGELICETIDQMVEAVFQVLEQRGFIPADGASSFQDE